MGTPTSLTDTALLAQADSVRRAVAPGTTAAHKAHLGQFMTPAPIAHFMASLFYPGTGGPCRLLDAGAGVGALTAAFLDRWQHEGFGPVSATAFEIDPPLRAHLSEILGARSGDGEVRVRGDDFIAWAVAHLNTPAAQRFTHVILNPPYKKLGAQTPQRAQLRSVGIEASNLYAAFVALALACLEPGGQIVAIVPRSFCNGPYHKAFRRFLLAHGALRRLHLFQSRTQAFQDDGVLQETLIIHLERGAAQGPVQVSVSTDAHLADLVHQEHPFGAIVDPGDPDRFIQVPLPPTAASAPPGQAVPPTPHTLADLGVRVATGPLVAFRVKDHLRAQPGPGAVPLLHPGHFSAQGLTWPRLEAKKPNALVRTPATERGLYPNACCVLVRRVSSKEEARRVVARVFDPADFPGATHIGFENHLNVLHAGPEGLPLDVAWGLQAYLGTAGVDAQFRRFSGHTQVNATDLRRLRFPGRAVLAELGAWCRGNRGATPAEVEAQWLALATANRIPDQDQRAGVEPTEIG